MATATATINRTATFAGPCDVVTSRTVRDTAEFCGNVTVHGVVVTETARSTTVEFQMHGSEAGVSNLVAALTEFVMEWNEDSDQAVTFKAYGVKS